jgi:uncharacterized repeat protein (TIGR03803 family)
MDKVSRWKWACAVFLLCPMTTICSPAQTFTTIVNFDYANGAAPYLMSLVQGTDGNLYGTTSVGGANGPYGTVFKITPGGTLTTLHSFAGYPTEGQFPSAAVVQGSDGNFYGTTEEGGTNNGGTVFKITPGGVLTTLHNFCAQDGCNDGQVPDAALIQGSDGNLYGTTQLGGVNGLGTVFKITPGGRLNTVYSFCAQANCADGAYPNAALIQARDGNFYGTTAGGGDGTVFRITPAGALTTLHSFNGTDGYLVVAGLVQASDRNFYGTASAGGPNGSNAGTVFKITPTGVLTTLYSFCTQPLCADGVSPETGVVQATDGNFYGTTELGGVNGSGTVFRITPGGALTTLYSLCAQANCADGSRPRGGLVQATNGTFYGTTFYGGTYDEGTIFRLSVGLGPFVETRPTAGKVGAKVTILGTNLAGTTDVSFNGTSATFAVVSSTEIKTRVPTGATSGKVSVTTPHGTLLSNVAFRVIP